MKKFNQGEGVDIKSFLSLKILKVMRITLTLLFLATLHLFAGNSYSQSTKLSLNLHNASIENVLDEIEQQSEFYFVLNYKLIDVDRLVDIRAQNQSILEVLTSVFSGSDVDYVVLDRQILLSPRSYLKRVKARIQPVIVTGTVADEDGNPLPGVNIIIKGTSQGSISDAKGKYTIHIEDSNTILVFSFIGMITQEVRVGNQTEINITMNQDAIGLEEVVAIGYGKMKKNDLTGAIGIVKVDDLPLVNTSVTQMLAGRVSGVQIRADDAQPGGAVTVLIRGAGSTGAGNEPLFIIDGFPLTNDAVDPNSTSRYINGSRSPLNSINPNDIESIEILKDVSAASIYGARAANGVVLITTKSGKKGDATINYSFKQSVQTIYKGWDMMNATDYMKQFNDHGEEMWRIENEIGVYGDVDPSTVIPYNPTYTQSDIAQAGEGTDWFKEISRVGKIQDHNLSISGGNEKTTYLLSFNSFDQKGIIKNSNFNRMTGRLNLDQQIRDWLKVGIRATGSRINIDNAALTRNAVSNYLTSESGIEYRGASSAGIISSAINFLPTYPVRDADGNYSQNLDDAPMPNPVSFFEITNNTVLDRLFAQSYLEVEPVSNLKIRAQLGFDKQEGITSLYLPKSFIHGFYFGGQASISQMNKFDKIFNTTVTYNKDIIDGHKLNALLGYEFQEFEFTGHNLYNTNFTTDAFLYNNIGSGQAERPDIGSYKTLDKLVSYFGRINYNILDKYLFTFSLRADGSTKFGKGHKYGYFPSGAIAWRIVNEEFMKNINWLSNLKLRLSTGQTGNSNISGAFAYYQFGTNYQFGNSYYAGSYF